MSTKTDTVHKDKQWSTEHDAQTYRLSITKSTKYSRKRGDNPGLTRGVRRKRVGNSRLTRFCCRKWVGHSRLTRGARRKRIGNSRLTRGAHRKRVGNSRLTRVCCRKWVGHSRFTRGARRKRIGNSRLTRGARRKRVDNSRLTRDSRRKSKALNSVSFRNKKLQKNHGCGLIVITISGFKFHIAKVLEFVVSNTTCNNQWENRWSFVFVV